MILKLKCTFFVLKVPFTSHLTLKISYNQDMVVWSLDKPCRYDFLFFPTF